MVCMQDATVVHYTRYTVTDLIDTAHQLNTMLMSPTNKLLKTILLKYSHRYDDLYHLLAYTTVLGSNRSE